MLIGMRRNQKALRNTAIHESVHAVEAFMLGVRFRSVTIRADGESLGHVMLQKWPKWAVPDTAEYHEGRARAWFEKRIRISQAGQIAEAIHAGRRPSRHSHASDDAVAVHLAVEMCGSEEECSAWLNLLFIRTRNQLSSNPFPWVAVEALAQELLKRQTLTGAEAREIIRNAINAIAAEAVPRLC